MKAMKNLLVLIFSLAGIRTAYPQFYPQPNPFPLSQSQIEVLLKRNERISARYSGKPLSSLSPAARDSFLIAKAREVVLVCGPDYYREYKQPEIVLRTVKESETIMESQRGQRLYEITFPYDTTKERFYGFAARVTIFEKTGEPFIVCFGCAPEHWLIFYEKSYSFSEGKKKGLITRAVYCAIKDHASEAKELREFLKHTNDKKADSVKKTGK